MNSTNLKWTLTTFSSQEIKPKKISIQEHISKLLWQVSREKTNYLIHTA